MAQPSWQRHHDAGVVKGCPISKCDCCKTISSGTQVLREKKKIHILVLDLGGSTFDVALVCAKMDDRRPADSGDQRTMNMSVECVGGNLHLGGHHFTQAFRYVLFWCLFWRPAKT